MIEADVRDYLLTKVNVPVYLDAPKVTPNAYIKVFRNGTSGTRFLESALFTFHCIASTLLESAALSEQLKEAMYDMPSVPKISKVELNAETDWTDTATREYRYQSVYEITYHR